MGNKAGDQQSAFGELLAVPVNPQIQLSFTYGLNPRLVTVTETDTATVSVAGSMVTCSTGIGAAASAQLESTRILRYGNGQGGLIRFTAVFDDPVADTIQIIGLGDDLDGYFIGYDGLQFGVMRRDAGVDHWTYDGDFAPPATEGWSSDASGGRTFPNNPQLGNVFQIRYQWLGFGMITFSTEHPETGSFRGFHAIRYANTAVVPSIRNPQLPLCIQAANLGNTTDIAIKTASMMGAIEGVVPNLTLPSTGSGTHLATTTEENIFVVRSKDTFEGVRNRVEVLLADLNVSLDTGGAHQFKVYLDSVPTGPVWSDLLPAESTLEIDTTSTLRTGGFLVFQGFLNGGLAQHIPVFENNVRFRRLRTLTVTVQRIGGNAGTASASMTFNEFF
jgi:hypothetical protein